MISQKLTKNRFAFKIIRLSDEAEIVFELFYIGNNQAQVGSIFRTNDDFVLQAERRKETGVNERDAWYEGATVNLGNLENTFVEIQSGLIDFLIDFSDLFDYGKLASLAPQNMNKWSLKQQIPGRITAVHSNRIGGFVYSYTPIDGASLIPFSNSLLIPIRIVWAEVSGDIDKNRMKLLADKRLTRSLDELKYNSQSHTPNTNLVITVFFHDGTFTIVKNDFETYSYGS